MNKFFTLMRGALLVIMLGLIMPSPINVAHAQINEDQFQPDSNTGLLIDCAASDDGCVSVGIDAFLLQAIQITGFLLSIAGTIAFIMFIVGGFSMILSMGNPEKFKNGRNMLIAAIVGLLIALSAYILVQFVLGALGVESAFRGV